MLFRSNNDKPVLGLVLPYTPYEKQNLTAYLIGTTIIFLLILVPATLRLAISFEILSSCSNCVSICIGPKTLLPVGYLYSVNFFSPFSQVPINNSLLYVETIYQQDINEENSTPMLKKVVVASGNKVAIGNNLKEALENLLSQDAVDIEVESTDTVEQLVQAIVKANGNLKKSNENNNWEMIGKDMNKLQELIDKLDKLLEEQRKENQKNENKNQNDNNVISNNEA